MSGPLPDISMIDRFSPILETMRRPVCDDPVKPIASTPGWVTSASPISPPPGITLMAPAGVPASSNTFAISSSAQQVNSGGLTIMAFPVAKPGPTYSIGIITGKFHGVIAAQTPTGRRTVNILRFRSVVGIRSPLKRLASSAAIWK